MVRKPVRHTLIAGRATRKVTQHHQPHPAGQAHTAQMVKKNIHQAAAKHEKAHKPAQTKHTPSAKPKHPSAHRKR